MYNKDILNHIYFIKTNLLYKDQFTLHKLAKKTKLMETNNFNNFNYVIINEIDLKDIFVLLKKLLIMFSSLAHKVVI